MGSKTMRKISMGVIKVSTAGQVVCVTSKQQKDGAFAETQVELTIISII